MPRRGLGLERWQQRPDRQADIADKTKVELATPAQILRPDVDLRDLAVGREKLLVGKIGSQHQQHVAVATGTGWRLYWRRMLPCTVGGRRMTTEIPHVSHHSPAMRCSERCANFKTRAALCNGSSKSPTRAMSFSRFTNVCSS